MGGMPVADAKLAAVLQTDLAGPLLCARAFVRQRPMAAYATANWQSEPRTLAARPTPPTP